MYSKLFIYIYTHTLPYNCISIFLLHTVYIYIIYIIYSLCVTDSPFLRRKCDLSMDLPAFGTAWL